jgi:SAM-dependent methyltransferase
VSAAVVDVDVEAPRRPFALRTDDGRLLPLHVDRWFAEPSHAEHEVLALARGPVLDVGCGPGRHTLALLRQGVSAVGLDVSAAAVLVARGRGAPALHRSVFDRLPDEGMWGTALLLDGNVGIGGDPVGLLSRLRRTLRRGGRVLLEVERPGTPTESVRVRLEGRPEAGSWFPWARVGADGLSAIAGEAGLRPVDLWPAEGRWFGRLDA